MKIHEIPYVPREIPVDTKQEHKGTFEEELRKQMRGHGSRIQSECGSSMIKDYKIS